MTEIEQVLATIKRELRAKGITYREVAKALDLSETSVKRLFSVGTLTLDRLAAIAELLDLTVAELVARVAESEPKVRQLSVSQEAELVADVKLLLVAACVISQWTAADIVASYQVSEAECVQRLLKLDKLRLIDLLPGNRVRLNIARDFDWRADGPIRTFFRAEGENDFLDAPFTSADESYAFVHGMLTDAATAELHTHLTRLRQQFSLLHNESLRAPFAARRGTALLLASRRWEPRAFADLHRVKAVENRRVRKIF